MRELRRKLVKISWLMCPLKRRRIMQSLFSGGIVIGDMNLVFSVGVGVAVGLFLIIVLCAWGQRRKRRRRRRLQLRRPPIHVCDNAGKFAKKTMVQNLDSKLTPCNFVWFLNRCKIRPNGQCMTIAYPL